MGPKQPGQIRLSLLAAALLATSLAGSGARAAYTVTYSQDGANVVASGHGTVDIGGLSYFGTDDGNATGQVIPSLGIALSGPAPAHGSIDVYEGAIGPTSLGGGEFTAATSGSGDFAGVGGHGQFVSVPTGYVSGNPLSDFSTYDGETLASLGMTPGTYVYHWGSGVDADSFTVQVGSDALASTFTVSYQQVGNDVVAVGNGRINLNALSYFETDDGNATGQVIPSLGIALSGPAPAHGSIDAYEGAIGPASVGRGEFTAATSGSGDFAGVGGHGQFVSVPEGYVSGNPVSDVSTYADETFASLGLTPGTYIYHWGAGADAGIFTVEIGSAIPEPSTWAMMLLGFVGIAGYRRAAINQRLQPKPFTAWSRTAAVVDAD